MECDHPRGLEPFLPAGDQLGQVGQCSVTTPELWNPPACWRSAGSVNCDHPRALEPSLPCSTQSPRAEGGGTGPAMTQTKLPLQLFPAAAAAGQLALGGRLQLQEPNWRCEQPWDVQWCLKYSNMTGFSLEPRWVLVAQPVHLEKLRS